MTRTLIAAISVLILTSFSATVADRCKVTDPTGTPLNVRESANGKIVGTVPNGALVTVTESAVDAKGNPWVHVAHFEDKKDIGGYSASLSPASDRGVTVGLANTPGLTRDNPYSAPVRWPMTCVARI
jgi:hypothetical protein